MKPPLTFGVFQPAGLIASQERDLIIQAALLMLIVVIPIFILAFSIAWHYRASNTKAVYSPDWEHSKMDELVWWAIPLEIILVLSALTWTSTHALDPRKPLAGQTPLQIQVVALEWKWLFLYPSLDIATVNFVELPVDRPVDFEITADAPMNSFWIPRLGGQIYAMTGMVNSLNLVATEAGDFAGGSANYSGDGFADMQFVARAAAPADFDAWVAEVKQSPQTLSTTTYALLTEPGASQPAYYKGVAFDLYNDIVMQFMAASSPSMHMTQ